jgi:hypothetical protein
MEILVLYLLANLELVLRVGSESLAGEARV